MDEHRYVRSRSTTGIWKVQFTPDGQAICPCPARVSECYHIRQAREMTEEQSDEEWSLWYSARLKEHQERQNAMETPSLLKRRPYEYDDD